MFHSAATACSAYVRHPAVAADPVGPVVSGIHLQLRPDEVLVEAH